LRIYCLDVSCECIKLETVSSQTRCLMVRILGGHGVQRTIMSMGFIEGLLCIKGHACGFGGGKLPLWCGEGQVTFSP
jgi:hypothetical protein